MIVAPGGGWVTQPEKWSTHPTARDASSTSGSGRRRRSSGWGLGARAGRCLSRPNPLGELERLLEERGTAYESADHVVDVGTS